jgi:hypothetical protein
VKNKNRDNKTNFPMLSRKISDLFTSRSILITRISTRLMRLGKVGKIGKIGKVRRHVGLRSLVINTSYQGTVTGNSTLSKIVHSVELGICPSSGRP